MSADSSLPPLKVLLVDDDPIVLTIVSRWLEDHDYEAVTHGSAFGTSGAILRHRPDVVLLDIGMPGLSGDALAKLISRQGQATLHAPYVIFHSGRDAKQLAQLVSERDALGAIRKTNDAADFIRQFRHLTAPLRPRRL